jgi:threonine aldolase
MDGARLSNAAVSLNVSLREITTDVGIDVLSFSGTKNGMMGGNAVIFFNQSLAKDFLYIRKQGMQLPDKARFIAAQFEAFLSNDLWKKNAQQANKMAKFLEQEILKIPQIKITQKVEANVIFAIISKKYINLLQEKHYFYV